jgi:hypothetical protein
VIGRLSRFSERQHANPVPVHIYYFFYYFWIDEFLDRRLVPAAQSQPYAEEAALKPAGRRGIAVGLSPPGGYVDDRLRKLVGSLGRLGWVMASPNQPE